MIIFWLHAKKKKKETTQNKTNQNKTKQSKTKQTNKQRNKQTIKQNKSYP